MTGTDKGTKIKPEGYPGHSLPLPAPSRAGIVTTLRTLAEKVPPGGPRIDPFPTLPLEAPHWGGRVTLIPKKEGWDYPLISEEIKNACHQGLITTVYCEAVLSNRNRDDRRQLGAAAAMLYHKGRESGHVAKVFGETVTLTDIWTRVLTPALDAITTLLSNKPAQTQESFKILLSSNAALARVLDPSAHEEQAASLRHLEKLGELFTSHPNIAITLQWLPKKIHFSGFRRAKQKALSAIQTTAATDIPAEPPSIKKLKESARDNAIAAWAEKWHLAPRTSLAYRTALRTPPDGKAHHTFHPEQLINKRPEQKRGEKKLVKFSRLTHSTFYRFVTGHAFTGEYTQRFFPLHTQDQLACPCGEPVQTIEHVLLHCPCYTDARQKHLTAQGRPRTLPQLFDKPERVIGMLRFLEETGACTKPRERWEPG